MLKENINESARRKALNIIEQWIKEEEERIKNIDDIKTDEKDESN